MLAGPAHVLADFEVLISAGLAERGAFIIGVIQVERRWWHWPYAEELLRLGTVCCRARRCQS